MEVRRIWPKGWRAIVLLLVGSVMGANLIAPAVAHVAGWDHNWTQHIRPRADARYVKKVDRNKIVRVASGSGGLVTLTGTFQTLAELSITAPGRGFVLVDGTSNIETFFENCNCIAELRLRDMTSGATSPAFYASTGADAGTDYAASQSWVFQVSASGARTFLIEGRRFNEPASTTQVAFSSAITGLYVPFGPTGSTTLAPIRINRGAHTPGERH
jgi:hypothetical protein